MSGWQDLTPTRGATTSNVVGNASCELDAEGHCITCSDEALEARVVRVDQQLGVAFVTIKDVVEEIDITLIDDVVPGDLVLVHGGVAISNLDNGTGGEEAEVRDA